MDNIFGWGGARALAIAVCVLACGEGGTGADAGGHEDVAPVSDEAIESDCAGLRPALSDCFVGGFFADCDGQGQPRFACTESDCRWFSGGCVAESYTASPCARDSLCCLENGPFSRDVRVRPDLGLLLYGWGMDPWDRGREMRVGVEVEASPEDLPAFSCTGEPPGPDFIQSPCTGGEGEWTLTHDGLGRLADTLVIQPFTDGVEGWTPVIELHLGGDEAGAEARVCTHYFTDTVPNECYVAKDVHCAVRGRVTLDTWPQVADDLDGLTGTLDVEFEAFTMVGGFTVTRVAEGP